MNTLEKKQSVLTPEILNYIESWKEKPGNLIMVLYHIQKDFGYISRAAAFEIADRLNVPVAKIYGVITFYNFFKLKKPGKHRIQICMGTACYLKGAELLLAEIENLLGVGIGSSTKDHEFSIETLRCVGCCGLSPVIMIDDQVYGNLVPDDLAGIIAQYKGK